jgi:hypothetical protein
MVTNEMVLAAFAGSERIKSDFWLHAEGEIDDAEYARRIDARWAREERLAAAVGPRPAQMGLTARSHLLPAPVRRALAFLAQL